MCPCRTNLPDVFFIYSRQWCPKSFRLGSEDAAAVPFKINVSVIERLRDLHFKWQPSEETQKSARGDDLLAVFNHPIFFQRFSLRMFLKAKDDPKAGSWNTRVKPNKPSEGSAQFDLPMAHVTIADFAPVFWIMVAEGF